MSAKRMAGRAPWTSLPTRPLQRIFHGLDQTIDRVRFMAVCTTFRLMVITYEPQRYIISNPLLLLPPPISDDSPIREFYNFADSKIYPSFVPELQGKWICGSSFGWLFTVDFSSQNIMLINPMTRSQIYLPPLSRFTNPPELDVPEFPRNNIWFIQKTAISSNPSRSENFIALATITDLKILAYYNSGGSNEWVNLPLIYGPAEDFRFYRGRFYVLTNWGAVITWDLRDDHQPISTTIIRPSCYDAYDDIPCRSYLSESVRGVLFKVCKNYKFDAVDDEEDYSNATKFELFKLDEEHEGWYHAVLHHLAVFVGCNTTICVSTVRNPEFEANGIYFADDNAGRCSRGDDPNGCNVVGCYEMDLDKVSKVYEDHPFWTSACIWVTPSS